MTDPNKTCILVLLDRSGSMETIAGDVIGGFNAFLAEQRRTSGLATLTLLQFNQECLLSHPDWPVGQVPELTKASYRPMGGTALYDAMGTGMDDLGRRLAALPEAERPGKVVVVIITDGQENASRHFTRERIRAMIRTQSDAYSWQFVYLGANQDAVLTGGDLGIFAGSCATFDMDKSATSFAMTSSKIVGLRSFGASVAYSAEDRATLSAGAS